MLSTKFSCVRLLAGNAIHLKVTNVTNNKFTSVASKVFRPQGSRPHSNLTVNNDNYRDTIKVNSLMTRKKEFTSINFERSKLLNAESVELLPKRSAGTYFSKSLPSPTLWKGVTSVSPQGKKRGRAKGLVRIKNLNRGQRIGWGMERIRFPGLEGKFRINPKALSDKEKQEIGKIEESDHKAYTDGLQELRDRMFTKRKRRRLTPLERGWTGGSPRGRKFGAPDPINPELRYDNFESILVEYRQSTQMSGKFGRIRGMKLIMVTGNRNGTAGFACTSAGFGRGPQIFTRAVNKAGLRLITFPRYEDRTVYHDFFTNFGETQMTVLQKPPGYGIKAHRLVTSVCELIGIKDLYVKIEGAMNYNHILKAFFLGLLRQRTHQELANEMRLHLVEFRKENHNFPRVVASPEDNYVRTKEEILPNEILDFQIITFDGNMPLLKPKPRPFYEKLPSWAQRAKKVKPQEHHFQHRIDMLVEHGREQSQYTDVFPECLSLTDQQKEHKKKKKGKNVE